MIVLIPGVERHGALAEQQVYAVLAVPLTRTKGELPGVAVTREDLLRQGRPIVGQAILLADHPDRPLEATGAKGLAAALCGEPTARDQDPVLHGLWPPRPGV